MQVPNTQTITAPNTALNCAVDSNISHASQFALANGIKLAVIGHASARKATISVSVNQGHFCNRNLPEGFVHLLEHMLFNASKQFPQTDALDKHLFQFHGQVNGWTQDTQTHFQLTCAPDGFKQACLILLDKLANPLFALADIEREISAIDAEFSLKKEDPIRQLTCVQKSTCNPQHPFARFSTGNKKTLSVFSLAETQQLLFDFHQQVFAGQHLSICIGLPQQDLNIINIASFRHLLLQYFTASTGCFQHTQKSPSVPLYLPNQLGLQIDVHHKAQQHQVLMHLCLPRNEPDLSEPSLLFLSHMLESKHENGLIERLKSQQLALDLHCFYKQIDNFNDELIISVQVSENGCDNLPRVYQHVFEYIEFLRSSGIEKWRIREKSAQYKLQNKLHRKTNLIENSIDISQKLHTHETIEECLQAIDFNVDKIHQYLPKLMSQLCPSLTRIYFVSPKANCQYITEHHQTSYGITKLDAIIQSPAVAFSKPRQNPYMSDQYRLISPQLEASSLIHKQSKQVDMKFYQDLSFGLPNGECFISITDPNMHQNAQQIAIKRVWVSALVDHLASKFFDAELASIHYRVYAHHHGISIHTGGLSDRQLLLCIELMNAIIAFKADKKTLLNHINQSANRIEKNLKQKPFNQLFAQLNELYQSSDKSNKHILRALKSITADDILKQQQSYFEHNFVETLLIGNWQEASAERFFQQLKGRFSGQSNITKPIAKTVPIKSAKHYHYWLKDCEGYKDCKDHNYIWHIIPALDADELSQLSLSNKQAKKLKLDIAARSLMLEKLLSQSLFDILRQKYQMGYMLGVGYKPVGSYPGIAMYIVSPSHDLSQIHQAMHEVVKTNLDLLKNGRIKLQRLIKELINQVKPQETDISQRANRAWLHFDDEQPLAAHQDLADSIATLNTDTIMMLLENILTRPDLGQVIFTQSAQQHQVIAPFKKGLAGYSLKPNKQFTAIAK